jgi:murein DD-endopeptidase MepM/ murein hydrolase activator NlpD
VGHRPGRGIGAGRGSESGLALLPLLFIGVVLILGIAWFTGALEYGWWWATNTTPPAVRLAGPAEAVRGQVPVAVQLDPADRASVIEATVDGRPLAANGSLTVDTTSLPDGDHQVVVVAEDHSWRQNRGRATATIRSDNTPPQLTVEAQPERVLQGHTMFLRVRTNEPASIQARLGDRPLEIQPGNGFGWAIVGFGPRSQPSTLPLVVDGTDALGNRAEKHSTVTVGIEEFPRDQVEVPPTLLPLLGQAIRDEEDRKLAPTYQQVTQPRLWEGRFLRPVQGQVITEFGEIRSYNGGPEVGHHNGTDFAAPERRPVVAPGRGKVARVDQVQLRGNVVILDHGLGVFTTYAHLASVDVQVGQVVDKGQPFAKVGNTGLSTGPHLHWELWVNGQNVDPMEWVERDVP